MARVVPAECVALGAKPSELIYVEHISGRKQAVQSSGANRSQTTPQLIGIEGVARGLLKRVSERHLKETLAGVDR